MAILTGTDNDDVLVGSVEADTLLGLGANDVLEALDGNDFLQGNAGNDVLFGRAGEDTLRGGKDNDVLNAEAGDDQAFGDAGNDTLEGGTGNDQLYGGSENDSLTGGEGNDFLQGNAGADTLIGGGANDTLFGGRDNDSLTGDAGNDSLAGNLGNDTLNGGEGDDILRGGDNNDSIVSGTGNDDVNGNQGNDTLFGDDGNDVIQGGKDNDEIHGGNDVDIINGNLGSDNIFGDAGNDIVRGGQNQDTVNGGDGNDTIHGDKGNDILTGGAGNDSFVINLEAGALDTITDFEVSNTNEKIDLSAFTNLSNFTDLNLSITSTDTILALGNFQVVTIKNVLANALSGDNFTFFNPQASTDTGQTFTLTSNIDVFTGGTANDTFTTADANLSAFDLLSAGAGIDTLRFTDAATLTLADLQNKTGFEIIDVSAGNSTVQLNDSFAVTSATQEVEVSNGTRTVALDTSAVSLLRKIFVGGSGTATLAAGVQNRVFAKDAVNTTFISNGFDIMIGGTGNNTFEIDADDTWDNRGVIDGGSAGTDVINIDQVGTVDFTVATLRNIDNINVGNDATTLIMNDENVTVVMGNGGNVFTFGNGQQQVTLGSGNDTINIDITDTWDASDSLDAGGGTDTVIISGVSASDDYTLGTFDNVENIRMTGTGQNVTLDNDGYTITMEASNQTLTSGSGGDTITVTGIGAMSISSGNGNDALTIDGDHIWSSADTINLGGGTDTLTINNGGTVDLGPNGVDASNIENIILQDPIIAGSDPVEREGTNVILPDGTALTVTAGLGADTITSGNNADAIALGVDSVSDIVRYSQSDDGAAAGANTGHDVITEFNAADDDIAFTGDFNDATMGINLDDVTDNNNFTFVSDEAIEFNTVDIDPTDGYTQGEALLITAGGSMLTNADLTQLNFTNLLTAINGLEMGAGVSATAGQDGLIVAQGTSQTGIYLYISDGGAVDANDLTLLGTVNGLLGADNFTFV